jgi:hypothetical protein
MRSSDFIAPQLPRRGGGLHLVHPPLALGVAEDGGGGQRIEADGFGAGHFLRFHAVEQVLRHQVARADAAGGRGRVHRRFRDHVVGTVQALVGHHQLHQLPNWKSR